MTADDILRVPAGHSSDSLRTVILEWAELVAHDDPQLVLAYVKWEIERRLTGDTRKAFFGQNGPIYLQPDGTYK